MKIPLFLLGMALVLVILVTAFAVPVAAFEVVEFPSGAKTSDKAIRPTIISGSLYKPEGPGSFPAVVILHGCGGIQRFNQQLARRMAGWGYVSLVVNSFAPRGMRRACGQGRAVVGFRIRDAYGALSYLQNLSFVDGKRVGAVGFSQGAWTLLLAVREKALRKPDSENARSGGQGRRFKAAVAYYPWCPMEKTVYYPPLLILIGEKDDWTFAYRCEAMAREGLAGGGPIELKVYPGAFHGFVYGIDITVQGHRIAYDPAATEDSIRRVKAFLAKNL